MKKKVFRERNEVSVDVVQAVANAIVEEAEEQGKKVEEIVAEIVEESKPVKRGRRKSVK